MGARVLLLACGAWALGWLPDGLAVLAHGTADAPPAGRGPVGWLRWREPDWLVPLGLAIAAMCYVRGMLALTRRKPATRIATRWHAAAFGAGLLALAAALGPPLETWAGELSSAHMVQHSVLMLVGAPLLVGSRPVPVLLAALPVPWRRSAGRLWRRVALGTAGRVFAHPISAWALFALALWIWHIPALYQAALASDVVHGLQHAAFYLTACLYWSALLEPLAVLRGPARHAGGLRGGAAALYLFTTSLHAAALGIFLALSPRPWYPAYGAAVRRWGLTPLEDQQLAGLIMWVPGCTVYALAAVGLFAAWLAEPGP